MISNSSVSDRDMKILYDGNPTHEGYIYDIILQQEIAQIIRIKKQLDNSIMTVCEVQVYKRGTISHCRLYNIKQIVKALTMYREL